MEVRLIHKIHQIHQDPLRNQFEYYFDEALQLAKIASECDEVPVGAVVVYQNKVIGKGYNLRESSHNPAGHAEIIAIQAAAQTLGSWKLADCELYVTLEPCPMCLATAQQARLSKIIYGARDLKGGALSLGYHLHQDQRLHHRMSVEYQEYLGCGKILTDFFSSKRLKNKRKI